MPWKEPIKSRNSDTYTFVADDWTIHTRRNRYRYRYFLTFLKLSGKTLKTRIAVFCCDPLRRHVIYWNAELK